MRRWAREGSDREGPRREPLQQEAVDVSSKARGRCSIRDTRHRPLKLLPRGVACCGSCSRPWRFAGGEAIGAVGDTRLARRSRRRGRPSTCAPERVVASAFARLSGSPNQGSRGPERGERRSGGPSEAAEKWRKRRSRGTDAGGVQRDFTNFAKSSAHVTCYT